jgi:large subunit ribosomal protein L29
MKASEMRDLSLKELKARKADEEEVLQEMRFDQAVTGQIENPARIPMTKREIARLNTVIHEKENQNATE